MLQVHWKDNFVHFSYWCYFFCVRLLQRKPVLVSANSELHGLANCPTGIAQEWRGTYRDLWEQFPKRSGIYTGASLTLKVPYFLIAVGISTFGSFKSIFENISIHISGLPGH